MSIMILLKDERGYALAISIMVLLVISLLGASLLGIAMTNYKLSNNDRDFQSVYYIAEAGARYSMEEISSNIKTIYDNSSSKGSYFTNLDTYIKKDINNKNLGEGFFDIVRGVQPTAQIICTRTNYDTSRGVAEYTLTSKGDFDGVNRQVQFKFYVEYPIGFSIDTDYAVFVDQNISLEGGAKIYGDVGINSVKSKSIFLKGGTSINGDFYVNSSAPPDVISYDEGITPPTRRDFEGKSYSMPPFPSFPNYDRLPPYNVPIYGNLHAFIGTNGNMNVDSWGLNNFEYELLNNAYIPKLTINQNITLILKLDKDISLLIDEINITQGHVVLTGKGTLTLYVRDKIYIKGGFNDKQSGQTDNQTSERLVVYYSGSTPLDFSNETQIWGSLYAERAKITLSGGGGFKGNIITGSNETLTIKDGAGAVSRLIFAPNAQVSLLGGGTVKGAIIGKSFKAEGGTIVEFATADKFPENPFASENPSVDKLIPTVSAIREN